MQTTNIVHFYAVNCTVAIYEHFYSRLFICIIIHTIVVPHVQNALYSWRKVRAL